MTGERLGRFGPAVCAFAVAIVFLVWSYAYEGRAHVVPMLIGWSAALLTLLDIAAQTRTRAGRLLHGLLSGLPLDGAPAGSETAAAARPSTACLWIAGFVALVAAVGFLWAIPVYALAFMRRQGRVPWRRALAVAASVTLVSWLVFERLLRYRVFEGAVFGGQF